MNFLQRLRDQPAPSVLEIVVVFFMLDVPRVIGSVIAALVLGLAYWPAYVVGVVVMLASLLAYMAIRREVLR